MEMKERNNRFIDRAHLMQGLLLLLNLLIDLMKRLLLLMDLILNMLNRQLLLSSCI